MSNDNHSPSEPQPQPYIAPKGPEFGGPGYDPYVAHPLSAPSPQEWPVEQVQPYQPPVATPAPVVAPVQPPPQPGPYGYPAAGYQQPMQQMQPMHMQQMQPMHMQQPMHPYYRYGQLVQPDHPVSGTVLVLGILSFFFLVTAPFAWFMGSRAKKEVANGAPYRWSAAGQVGYVLGIIYSLGLAFIVAMFMLGIMVS